MGGEGGKRTNCFSFFFLRSSKAPSSSSSSPRLRQHESPTIIQACCTGRPNSPSLMRSATKVFFVVRSDEWRSVPSLGVQCRPRAEPHVPRLGTLMALRHFRCQSEAEHVKVLNEGWWQERRRKMMVVIVMKMSSESSSPFSLSLSDASIFQ